MKDLKKMKADLAALRAQGRTALDALNALEAKADRTEAETARAAQLDAEVTRIEAEVQQLEEAVAEQERKERRAAMFSAPRSPAGSYAVNDRNPEATGRFANIAEFAMAVRQADVGHSVDQRLLATTPQLPHQNNGVSGEGYLVPPQFREEIWENVFEANTILSAMAPEPTSSNTVGITLDETTPWGSNGIRAYWGQEAGLMTASRTPLKGALVELHKLYAFVEASDELLQDAPRLASRLTRKAADAITFEAGEALVNGSGVGKPLGFMQGGSKIAVAKETSQTAQTINIQNLAKMIARAKAGPGSFWMANQDILPQLITMTLGNVPVWIPMNQGVQGAPGGTLMGYPVYFVEHAQTIGTEGDIVFVNPQGYYAVTKASGIEFAQSMHLYFDRGLGAFRWTFRLGGQPTMTAPITRKNGANSLSHFVSLATRA